MWKHSAISVVICLSLLLPATAALPEPATKTLQYVYDGSSWVPWLGESNGTPEININLLNITSDNLIVNESLIHTSTGQVGVGTTSPSNLLHVNGGFRLGSGTGVDTITTDTALGTSDSKIPTEAAVKSYVQTVNVSQAGGVTGEIQYNDGGPLGGASTLHWDSVNSRLGIGTASPSYTLDVQGAQRITGDLRLGNELITTSADVAEWLPAANPRPEPGDVVVVDDDGEIAVTSQPGSDRARGVITTDPAVKLGDQSGDTVGVALTGTVPVHVTDENGGIRPGDLLVTSSNPGYAMRADGSGVAVGTALEPMTGEQGEVRALLSKTKLHGDRVDELERRVAALEQRVER